MRDKRRRQRQKIVEDDQAGEINVFNEEQLTMESHADEAMNFEGSKLIKRRVQKVHEIMGKRNIYIFSVFIK